MKWLQLMWFVALAICSVVPLTYYLRSSRENRDITSREFVISLLSLAGVVVLAFTSLIVFPDFYK